MPEKNLVVSKDMNTMVENVPKDHIHNLGILFSP